MRVLVIGSTGVIGRDAVPLLVAAGHKVTGLARNPDRAGVIEGQGIDAVVGDLFSAESMASALTGQEAVLNLATRIPATPKAMLRGMKENDRIRRDGSAALVEAALASDDVRVIVQEGISFVYADGGDSLLTEDAAVDAVGPTRSSLDAHAAVAGFAATGRTGVRLRISAMIGDEPFGHLLPRLARWRVPVMYGDPRGWFTAIRPSDAAAGVVAALGAPSGVYNVGASPVRKSEFAAVVAAVAGVRRARIMSDRFLVGQFKTLGRSQRVDSSRLTHATGWRPAHPSFEAGWFPRSGK